MRWMKLSQTKDEGRATLSPQWADMNEQQGCPRPCSQESGFIEVDELLT
jgi:hypothetical protein